MPASKATETLARPPALGGSADDPRLDFFVDPRSSQEALEALERVDASGSEGGVLVRAARPLAQHVEGFGPAPAPFAWMRVRRRTPEIELDGALRRVGRVRIDRSDEPCCDAPSCERRREIARVVAVLEPGGDGPSELIVAEESPMAGDTTASARSEVLAHTLGRVLGVPVDGDRTTTEAVGEGLAAERFVVASEEIHRFGLRREGDRVVVRDWHGRGPRASVPRNTTIGLIFYGLAIVAWLSLARAISGGAGAGEIAGVTAGALLLTLAGTAFTGVARFSAKYTAGSTALVAIGKDQLIVLPWVGRDGAVDRRPEGRLGAAIPLGEVRSARTRVFGDDVAVELDTDHGVLDAMTCATQANADRWVGALNRVLDEARHPRANKTTAKQRARERA